MPVRTRKLNRYRSGVLTVDMAICIPIVFLILLGTLEFSRMNMLRNSIDNGLTKARGAAWCQAQRPAIA